MNIAITKYKSLALISNKLIEGSGCPPDKITDIS